MAISGNKTVTFVLVLALLVSSISARISARKYHTFHHIRDSHVPAKYDRNRALHSLPSCLVVKESSIPDAGLGVFAIRDIPSGVVFGPYGGVKIYDREEAPDSGYVWKVLDIDGEVDHFIDGEDKARSNWIRYVNSACTEEQQNLNAFQYKSGIYYYSHKEIPKGGELLVWYGDEYGEDLGIIRDWALDDEDEEDHDDDEYYVDDEEDEDYEDDYDDEDEDDDGDEDEEDGNEDDEEDDDDDDDDDDEVSDPLTCFNEKFAVDNVDSFIHYITGHAHIHEEDSSFLGMTSHVKAGLVVIILLVVIMMLIRKHS